MHLVANYRAVLKHAWSVKLLLASIVVQLLLLLVPGLIGQFPPAVISMVAVLLDLATFAARLVAQRAVETIVSDPDWETGDGQQDPH